MKSRTLIAAAALALVGAGVSFQLLRSGSSSAKASPMPGSTPAPAAVATPAGAPLAVRSRAAGAPAPAPAEPPAEPPGDSGAQEAVGRTETVVTVNGLALTGADVVAFSAADGDELSMTEEMYEFLVKRAIDRELTFQAARDKGIELDADGKAQLAQVRANAEERGEADPARIAFEEKEARAQLLLKELVAADGAPPELADDAAVDRYLEEHAADIGALPKEPERLQQIRIEVRQQLYTALAAKHEARVRDYLASLARHARIER